ncbi:tetraspanin-3-like [Erpetoichthys calabaricus]|uniref:Tetraspanin 37 n=1 Tax=Erpetoichthys calabaricus TaxID=27687 RepID=A0A8C4SNE5_ERPCA|nr:tetraspanin-3-like [Erpetoichthys calabaricus]
MSDRNRRASGSVLRLASLLSWVAALVVLLASVCFFITFLKFQIFFSDIYIIVPIILATAVAATLFFASFIGCCIKNDSPCLQGMFVYLLVIAFYLEAAAIVLTHLHSAKVDTELTAFEGVLNKYNETNQNIDTRAVDDIQEELQCCGIQNVKDWEKTPWFIQTREDRVPHSCCNSTYHNCTGSLTDSKMLYDKGCQVVLKKNVSFNFRFILWSLVATSLLQVVELISIAILMNERVLPEYRILLDRDTYA